MSQENIEAVKRHLDAWNLCDPRTWLASFHPDAEVDWSRPRGPHRRLDGDAGYWRGDVAG